MWAARSVLELEPKWLTDFFLFDINPDGVRHLEELKEQHPDRRVRVYEGDFNERVHEILRPEFIHPKRAAFCLIDQRTTECHWETLAALAGYKREGLKIELFYFLANGWLERTLKSRTTPSAVGTTRAWWGRPDWRRLLEIHGMDRGYWMAQRFQKELGYASALAWPIYKKGPGGGIMYFMIHATDHARGPALMADAYAHAREEPTDLKQIALRLKIPAP